MTMRHVIQETSRGTMSEKAIGIEFLNDLTKQFAKNEKTETNTLLTNLVSKRYKAKGNIWEYILEISHIALKLKVLKLELSEDLLMHLFFIYFPAQFNQFKVCYNCQKEK